MSLRGSLRRLLRGRDAPAIVDRRGMADMLGVEQLGSFDSYNVIMGGAGDVVGGKTESGVVVTPERSLELTPVYSAVKVLAESIASMPLLTYRRTDDGGKERATDHPLYQVLRLQPNPDMSSIVWRETMVTHLGLQGNHYSEIVRDGSGRVRELYPLIADKTDIVRRNGQLYVRTWNGMGWSLIPDADVLRVPLFGSNGLHGYSPIGMARQAVGLGMAAEQFGSAFFGRGATSGGMLRHPGKLSPQARQNLKQDLAEEREGLTNAHRTWILEEGMEYEKITIPPEDAQFLETRGMQVEEISRIYRVPPHLLSDLRHATFSNIESQQISFLTLTLVPWLERIEQQIQLKLFGIDSEYFAEHLTENFLRGDIESRYGAYAIGIQNGFMTRAEARRMENLNPIEGLEKPLVPLNMVEAGEPAPMVPESDAEELARLWHREPAQRFVRAMPLRKSRALARRKGLIASLESLYLDAMARVVRREVERLRSAVRRQLENGDDAAAFDRWLEQFYRTDPDFREYFIATLSPTLRVMADSVYREVDDELGRDVPRDDLDGFIEGYLDTMYRRHSGSSQGQLLSLLGAAAGLAAAVEAIRGRLDEWLEKRAAKMARRELNESNNAFGRRGYQDGGVTQLVWITFGDSCPLCDELDGRVVGVERPFVANGETVGVGDPRELTATQNVTHPPLHDGCACMIGAA